MSVTIFIVQLRPMATAGAHLALVSVTIAIVQLSPMDTAGAHLTLVSVTIAIVQLRPMATAGAPGERPRSPSCSSGRWPRTAPASPW